MTKAWLPALVLLVAGFGGGYLLGSGESGGAAPAPLEDRDPQAAVRERPPLATADAPAADPGGPELATQEGMTELRNALNLVPASDIPRSSGVITGSVKTASGVPLAGIKVELTSTCPPDQKPGAFHKWQERPLEQVVRDTVSRFRWRRGTGQETTTGADGTFRFEGIADTTNRLSCSHPDYSVLPVDHSLSHQAKPGAHVEFRASEAVSVTFELRLPDGSEPERARLAFKNDAHHGHSWTPQRKTLTQNPGTYQVEITAGETNEYKSVPLTLVLEVGTPQSLTIDLTARPVLRGNLVYPDGETFPAANVYLARLPTGQRPDPARLKAGQSTWVLRAHRGGVDFTFSDLTPGRYALGATRSQRGKIVVTEVVQVGGALTEQDLVIPPLAREEYAILHVLGPDGAPLSGVQLTTGYRHKGGRNSGGGAGKLVRPDGSLWVIHHQGGTRNDPDGEYFIQATSTTYGSKEAAYRLGRAVELTIRFGRAGTIEVHVSGVSGTHYEGRVGLSLGGKNRRGQSGKLDSDGKMTQTGVQPGEYTISLNVKAERRSATVLRETITVEPGVNRVNLTFPELATVTVRGASGRVMLRSTSRAKDAIRNFFHAEADGDGRAVFDGLPPGAYAVHSGRKKAEFTVPGPSEIELR